MTDAHKITEVHPLPWMDVARAGGGYDVTDARGRRVLFCAWEDAEAMPVIMSLASALHAEREKVANLTRVRDAQAFAIRQLEERSGQDQIRALKTALTDAWKKLDAFEGRVREPDDGQSDDPLDYSVTDRLDAQSGWLESIQGSVTQHHDRLAVIEHRLTALERRAGPFARPMPDHPSESP